MTKNFLFIKQGSRLLFGVLATKSEHYPLGSSPRFFFSTPRDSLMNTLPEYKNIPFLQEKLVLLKKQIKAYKATLSAWNSSEPDYPLFYKVANQLAAAERLLLQITGGLSCP